MFSEGQDEAVSALSRAVRRARSGLAGGGFGGQLEDAEMLEDALSSKVFILINDGTFLGSSFLEGVDSLLEVSFFFE